MLDGVGDIVVTVSDAVTVDSVEVDTEYTVYELVTAASRHCQSPPLPDSSSPPRCPPSHRRC